MKCRFRWSNFTDLATLKRRRLRRSKCRKTKTTRKMKSLFWRLKDQILISFSGDLQFNRWLWYNKIFIETLLVMQSMFGWKFRTRICHLQFNTNNSREGRNVKNQNIKRSERQKFFKDDQNVERSERQKSERQKDHPKSKMTFNILIFFDAIGNIRTSKVLVHFLVKNTLEVLILLPMCTKACGGLG